MTRIAVLASFNMDLVMRTQRPPMPGETLQGEFAMHLGGKGFNQAVAARRLGADVAVTGRVGDDVFGARFLAALDAECIDRTAVTVDRSAATGVAAVVVDAAGENSIIQAPQANRALTPSDVGRLSLDGVAAALLNLETSMPAATAFARRARDGGARVILNPAPAGDVPPELLALADVLIPNAREASALAGVPVGDTGDAFVAAQALLRRGPDSVVITLGGRGAVYAAAGVSAHLPAFEVICVDAVGAGDAFCAALAVALAGGAPLSDAVRRANAAGALATTVHGAAPSMPTRAAVDALLARHPPAPGDQG